MGHSTFAASAQDDVIDKISYTEDGKRQTILSDPGKILERLRNATSDRLTRFDYSRGAAAQPYFFLYPAWQPLASLAWDHQREWAFWTPYGFYDASFNGHKGFGWQINQGVNRPVKFFRAAELKEELERPKMMQNLLSAGSVEAAFRVANLDVPGNLSDRLSATSRLKPTVRITDTIFDRQNSDRIAVLMAEVEIPHGVGFGQVRSFANGVPAIGQSLIREEDRGDQTVFTYRFEFDLPHDPQIKLQVLASSNLRHGAMAETVIEGPLKRPETKPRIFVMSLGVSDYLDSQIPQLDFADVNAETVLKRFDSRIQNDQGVLLTNTEASKGMWMVTSRSLAQEMKAIARPDDLLIVFLSGHGFRDPVSQEYFYLTSESKYTDVLSRRYGDCISFDELHSFADIACRKLLILDTCHSGSLQALRQQNLKSVVRTLENDLFFTLTASEGSQVAFESKQRGLGLFTSRLVDALEGQSDLLTNGGDGDGRVTLNEVIKFVKTTVPEDAANLGTYQFPTASPADLLDLVEIALTSVKPNEGRQR